MQGCVYEIVGSTTYVMSLFGLHCLDKEPIRHCCIRYPKKTKNTIVTYLSFTLPTDLLSGNNTKNSFLTCYNPPCLLTNNKPPSSTLRTFSPLLVLILLFFPCQCVSVVVRDDRDDLFQVCIHWSIVPQKNHTDQAPA